MRKKREFEGGRYSCRVRATEENSESESHNEEK